MVNQNDDHTDGNEALLGRRSVLALAGAATLAGVASVGTASANSDLPNQLVLDATDRRDPCTYAVEVSGELDVVPMASNDVFSATETTVEGAIDDGQAAIRYAGEVETLSIDGSSDVLFGDAAAEVFPDPDTELVVTGPDDVPYEFTTTGLIVPGEEGTDGAIVANDDGTYTARGTADDWARDSYLYEGDLVTVSPALSDYVVYVDGDVLRPTELPAVDAPETQRVGVRSSDTVEFECTVTGQAARVRDGSELMADFSTDHVAWNPDGTTTVYGVTDDGEGSSFHVEGDVVDFDASGGDYEILLDDEVVTAAELTGEEPDLERTLAITGPDDVSYEFTTTGEIEGSSGVVVENDDDTYTARGTADDWATHEYVIHGQVESFSPLVSDYVVYVDGDVVEPAALADVDEPETTRIGVRSPDSDFHFAFTTGGEVARVRDGSDMQAEFVNDYIHENPDGTYTVEAYTGNGFGDAFYVAGDLHSFSPLEGNYTLLVDGEEADVEDVLASAPAVLADPVIGGGAGYEHTVSPDEATTVVASRSELSRALSNASAGDVVYVAGDAEIDAGKGTFTVPAGVTLASDRGIDGASGGSIYTEEIHDDHYGMVRAERDARITGLRIEGPMDVEGWNAHSYDYEITGVYVRAPGVEVDNVDACRWGYTAIYTDDDTHVHHCELHHNNMEGLGYGVMTNNSANPVVEYNEFYHNRHAVAASGTGGFTARYNYVRGPTISHVFDQHRPGGTTTQIYNNTVAVVEHDQRDKNAPAVAVRGVPDDRASIYDNWFFNPKEPRSTPNDWTDEAIIQVHTSSWQDVHYWNNHYGEDEPAPHVGCPR